MLFDANDENIFNKSKTCYLCKECFTEKKHKVRGHDHRTGKFRGAAHKFCNVNYYLADYLPIVLHNLRGDDSHLILREASKLVQKYEDISAIPQTNQKFLTFRIGKMKFIDSYLFLGSSLEKFTDS